MKIRLAKKIMKCEIPDLMVADLCTNYIKERKTAALRVSPYWAQAWSNYCCYYKDDHRITKAISLTSKKKKHGKTSLH